MNRQKGNRKLFPFFCIRGAGPAAARLSLSRLRNRAGRIHYYNIDCPPGKRSAGILLHRAGRTDEKRAKNAGRKAKGQANKQRKEIHKMRAFCRNRGYFLRVFPAFSGRKNGKMPGRKAWLAATCTNICAKCQPKYINVKILTFS